jgi:hypothetical protein
VYFHVQLIKWVCCLRCSRGIQSTKAHPAFQGFGLCSQRNQEYSAVKCSLLGIYNNPCVYSIISQPNYPNSLSWVVG